MTLLLAVMWVRGQEKPQPAGAALPAWWHQPPPQSKYLEAANQCVVAWQSGDRAALEKIALDPANSTYLLVDRLLRFDMAATDVEARPKIRFLDCAEAYAAVAVQRLDSKGLPAFVRTVQALSKEDRAIEKSLQDLLDNMGRAWAAKDWSWILAQYEVCAGQLGKAAPTVSVARVHKYAGDAHEALEQQRQAMQAHVAAAAAAERIGSVRGQAISLSSAGIAAFYSGEVRQALSLWESERAILDGLREPSWANLMHLGNAASQLGTTAQAVEFYERARALTGPDTPAANLGILLMNLASSYKAASRKDDEDRTLRECIDTLRPLGDSFPLAGALHNAGDSLLVDGHFSRAETILTECIEMFRRIGSRSGVAAATRTLGVLAEKRGNLTEARQTLLKAERQFLDLDQPANAANVRRVVGAIAEKQCNYREALEIYRDTYASLTEAGDLRDAAKALAGIGRMLDSLGDSHAARAALEQSLEMKVRAGNQRDIAVGHQNLGDRLCKAGEFEGAERHLASARAILEQHGDVEQQALLEDVYATLESSRGQLQLAVSRRRATISRLGDSPLRWNLLDNLANGLEDLGLLAEAQEILEHCVVAHEKTGKLDRLAYALAFLADVHCGFEDYEGALGLLRRAEQIAATLGEAHLTAATQVAIGQCLAKRNDPGALAMSSAAIDALQTLGRPRDAIEASIALLDLLADADRWEETRAIADRLAPQLQASAFPDLDATLRRAMGRAACGAGRGERGIALLEESLAIARQRQLMGDVFITACELARWRHRAGDSPGAMEATREGLAAGLQQGTALGERDRRGLAQRLRDCVDVGIAAGTAPGVGDPGAATSAIFGFLEATRALILADAISHRSANLEGRLGQELLEAEAIARMRAAAATKRLTWSRQSGATEDEITGARQELDEAHRDLQDAITRIQRTASLAARLTHPSPLDLARARALLPAEATFVSYCFVGDRLGAFVLEGESARWIDLGGRTDAEARIEGWLRVVSVAGTDDTSRARDLYDILLRPLEVKPHVPGRRLWISPDGKLSTVPFDALFRVDGDEKQRAIEQWRISYLPSMTAYAALRETTPAVAGTRFLGVGDPVYAGEDEVASVAVASRTAELHGTDNLRRLPESGHEVRGIAALFGDQRSRLLLRGDATAAAVREQLSQCARFAAVHFACHGLVDFDRPLLSCLALSRGDALAVADIARLDLPADLVVLSACDSARGRLDRGEGIHSLARAFMMAGVPRVVASLWRVDDAATRRLMERFYRVMLEESLPADAALRAARLAAIRSAGEDAHPARWAAFVLWGLPE